MTGVKAAWGPVVMVVLPVVGAIHCQARQPRRLMLLFRFIVRNVHRATVRRCSKDP
jgi:hypothetical protein